MENDIIYKNCHNQIWNLKVIQNRVYTPSDTVVYIDGFSIIHGKKFDYGEMLPSGTQVEQSRMRNFLLYDPSVIRVVAEYQHLELDEFLDKMIEVTHNTVNYDNFFNGCAILTLASDGHEI